MDSFLKRLHSENDAQSHDDDESSRGSREDSHVDSSSDDEDEYQHVERDVQHTFSIQTKLSGTLSELSASAHFDRGLLTKAFRGMSSNVGLRRARAEMESGRAASSGASSTTTTQRVQHHHSSSDALEELQLFKQELVRLTTLVVAERARIAELETALEVANRKTRYFAAALVFFVPGLAALAMGHYLVDLHDFVVSAEVIGAFVAFIGVASIVLLRLGKAVLASERRFAARTGRSSLKRDSGKVRASARSLKTAVNLRHRNVQRRVEL